MKQTKKRHSGAVLWFTGLSGAGKSTIAEGVYRKLQREGYLAEHLDGDMVRQHLTKDLGFSKQDREENIRRVGFVAKLLSRNGVIVLASFISPYRQQREELRKETENFIEIYINTPLEICEARDSKELYAKARRGEIKNFTGIDDPYEIPKNPEISICCDGKDKKKKIKENVGKVIEYLEKNLKIWVKE